MSAAPDTRPSTTHPAWCDPRLCATDTDGASYHRAVVAEAGPVAIELEQVNGEPAAIFVEGVDNARLGPVAAANLAAQLVRAAALLTAGATLTPPGRTA